MISGSIFDKKDTIFKILIQGARKIYLHFRDTENAKIADLKIIYSSIDTGICATTRSNRRCQNWSSMEPHKPNKHVDKYGWTDNLCRNVDHNALWCYTTDPHKRWEDCDCNQKDGKYY